MIGRAIYQHLVAICLIAGMSAGVCSAQDYPTKEEINLARKFIDAEKERHLGNYQEAIRLFSQCLEADRENDAVYFGIGKVYLEQEMFAEAEQEFAKAYDLDPDNKWYALSYAQMLLEQLKFKEASKVYEKVSAAEPRDLELKMDYANTLLYAGKERKAMKVFDEIEAETGPTHEIARRKYDYLIGAHKYNEAAEELRKLIKVYPEDNQLYGMLAELYKAQGKLEEALGVYKEAYASNPDDPMFQLALAEYFDRSGMRDTAFFFLHQAYKNTNLDIDRKVGVLLRMYDEAERDLEIRKEVLSLCEAIVETHPDEAKSYSIYGDFLSLDGQRAAALEQFHNAVDIDPSRYAVWSQIFLIDTELDSIDALLRDSKRAMELFPAQPSVYFFNGVANSQVGNWKEAANSYRIGAQMVIGNKALSAQMLASLGDAYQELGEYASSDSAYEAALSYEPENVYVLNNYSYFLSLRGQRLEFAKEMSAKTLEAEPENASYLDTYGWILFQLGEYEKAARYLEKAINRGGMGSAEVLEHFGDVQYKLGNSDEALRYWKLAKEAGGDSEALLLKIASGKLNG